MKILEYVNQIRDKSKSVGNYRLVSEKSGVSYHWLQKFAIGSISNPTIENIAKLESFFDRQQHDEQSQPNLH